MKDANVIEKIRGSVTNNVNDLVNNPTWLSIYNSICGIYVHTSIRVHVGNCLSCLIKDKDCDFA